MVRSVPRQAEDRVLHDAGEDSRAACSPRRSSAPSAGSRRTTGVGTRSSPPGRTSSSTGSGWPTCRPVFEVLGQAGFTMAGGCGDTVRNVTGCPVSGVAASELFDVQPLLARGGAVLLRQSRVLRPAAEAQDHACRVPLPLQPPRDALHCARRRAARGASRLRGAGGRRALHRAPALQEPRRVRAGRRDDRGAPRDHRRLEGDAQVPDVPGEGAAQVHDGRRRAGAVSRAGGRAARAAAGGLRASRRAERRAHHRRASAAAGGAGVRRLPGDRRARGRQPAPAHRGPGRAGGRGRSGSPASRTSSSPTSRRSGPTPSCARSSASASRSASGGCAP